MLISPLLLHTGVSSLEGGERPYPERYDVPESTASLVNAVRHHGGRVIAAGTTVVRALATVTDDHGVVHPGHGWTDVVVSPERGVPSVDGLLTGWHEPESSHLMMLESFADLDMLATAYRSALDGGYLWHEFGDSHLILRDRERTWTRLVTPRVASKPRRPFLPAGVRCSTRCDGAARRRPSRSRSSSG